MTKDKCPDCDIPLNDEYGSNEVAEDGRVSVIGLVCHECGFTKEIKTFYTSGMKCEASGDSSTNPFEIIESDNGHHNVLVGRILQLMGESTGHISPIDYLYMTKIVQELVKR